LYATDTLNAANWRDFVNGDGACITERPSRAA
jgi:hypothetical protein